MKLKFKYIFPTSTSGANVYVCELPEGLGIRKIAYGTRMLKNTQTRKDIFRLQIFKELGGSKIQVSKLRPHTGVSSMGSLTLKFRKPIYCLFLKSLEALKCILKCKRQDIFNIKNQILAVVVLVLLLSCDNINKNIH